MFNFYLIFRCTGMSGGRYGTFEERFAEEVGRLSLKSIFFSDFDVFIRHNLICLHIILKCL